MNNATFFCGFKKCSQQLYGHIVARLPFILISLGIILRVKRWLENRSLWLDEAYLGIHLMVKSWEGILLNQRWSDDFPVPPMGFMLMEKINTTLFGNNELALRLFPLCCGIAAIVLFYVLAKKILSFRMMVFALALFVLNDYLIDYSAELKQYSTDLAVVLGLSVLFLVKTDECFAIKRKKFFLFAAAGMLAVTFSHPAIFVLAAFGICQQISLFKEGRVDDAKTGIKVGCCWLIVFGFWFIVSFAEMSSSPDLAEGARKAGYLIAMPFFSIEALCWYGRGIAEALSKVIGGTSGFAGVFIVLGMISIWKHNRKLCCLLFVPIGLALIAVGTGKYLMAFRFFLFTVPAVLIGAARGLDAAGRLLGTKGKLLVCGVAVFWFIGALSPTVNHFIYGCQKEESRAFLRFFQAHVQDGDVVMVTEQGTMALWYYLGQNKFEHIKNFILLSDGVKKQGSRPYIYYAKMVVDYDEQGCFYGYKKKGRARKLFLDDGSIAQQAQRIWVFASHLKGAEKFIEKYLKIYRGKPTGDFKKPGAILIMYEKGNNDE